MQLIIASQAFADVALRPIPGGYEAVLAGAALQSLLDATFGGASIEVTGEAVGGAAGVQGLDVTDIRMGGATTTVTLMKAGVRVLN